MRHGRRVRERCVPAKQRSQRAHRLRASGRAGCAGDGASLPRSRSPRRRRTLEQTRKDAESLLPRSRDKDRELADMTDRIAALGEQVLEANRAFHAAATGATRQSRMITTQSAMEIGRACMSPRENLRIVAVMPCAS